MEHEPSLGDLDQLVRGLESDLAQRLTRIEHKVDTMLSAFPTGPPARVTVAAPPTSPAGGAQSVTTVVRTGPVPAPPPPGSPPGSPFAVPAPHAGPELPPPPAGGPLPPPPPPGRVPSWAGPAPEEPTFDLDVTPEQLVRWAGLVLVALAAIFVVSTAIERGWIGPGLQLAGATAAGLGLLAGAFRLRDHGPGWPTSLGIVGATVLAFCATATHTWLDLVPAGVALVAVAAASAVSVTTAWRLGHESIAVAAGLATLSVPPALGLHHDLTPGLTALALAALVTAASTLGLVRPWPLVRTGISWLAALMALAVLADYDPVDERIVTSAQGPVAAVAVALITAALWLAPVLATLLVGRRPAPGDGGGDTRSPFVQSLLGPSPVGQQLAAVDHRLLAVVPGWCWLAVAAVIGIDRSRPFGVLGLAVGAGFAVVAAASWLRLPRALGLVQALGVSGVVAVALIALVDGPLLMVALTVQTAATAVVAYRFRDTALSVSAAVTGAAAVLLATGDVLRTIADGDPSVGGALAQAIVIGGMGATAAGLVRFGRRDLAPPAFVAAWSLALLWAIATFLPGPQGNVVVSGLWAAMAVGAIVGGLRWMSSTVRTVGLLTLVLAVGKLLTVDLAVVDVFWRAGLFFLVGAGLLRLAYVLPRLAAEARERAETQTVATPPDAPTPTHGEP